MRNSQANHAPMGIAQLDGKRVALWGWGREGRAAYRALRRRLPALPLTLFCSTEELAEAHALGDALLIVDTDPGAERLSAFEVVIKSPGISPYTPRARAPPRRCSRTCCARVATAPRCAGTSVCRCWNCWMTADSISDGRMMRRLRNSG